jgi:hypothetical protein
MRWKAILLNLKTGYLHGLVEKYKTTSSLWLTEPYVESYRLWCSSSELVQVILAEFWFHDFSHSASTALFGSLHSFPLFIQPFIHSYFPTTKNSCTGSLCWVFSERYSDKQKEWFPSLVDYIIWNDSRILLLSLSFDPIHLTKGEGLITNSLATQYSPTPSLAWPSIHFYHHHQMSFLKEVALIFEELQELGKFQNYKER